MQRRTLNLGILAHVDAGKTTLTERLLYAAGVIDELGSVDKGTTQTDSLALERQRGITIKAAVVSFAIGETTVNLVDTPGHPDFIAEVERVLGVLDGVVLVVSAVEGVQSQTRVLMRALDRLRLPTVIFVNKIDRPGADVVRVLTEIHRRLTPAAVALTTVTGEGTRAVAVARRPSDTALEAALVELLGEHDEALLEHYVNDESLVSTERLADALVAQTREARVHPVFHGSALTGVGVDLVTAGIVELLPASSGDADGPVSGVVFKIERGPRGDRIAYVRIVSGTLRTRDRVHIGPAAEGKVTELRVFEEGSANQRPSAYAGQIAKVWGLGDIRIGDSIEDTSLQPMPREFPPPTLESVVEPLDPDDRQRLRTALGHLAEQDPLIDVRQDDRRREISISLYGEVQKEVIEATLAHDYGIEVAFRETTPIYVERPLGMGEAVEVLRARTKTNVTGKSSPDSSNPFPATLGLRVEPAPVGSGIEFRLDVDVRVVPFYIYDSTNVFVHQMRSYVRETLEEGLCGWRVADCTVTGIECGYRAPGTTAADFRKLTPIVLMRALGRAGTAVCEPMARIELEVPTDAVGAVVAALARLGTAGATPSVKDTLATVETVLPAAAVRDVQRQLPGLTRGEGVLESSFAGYQPVTGDPPTRARSRPSPLDLEAYLAHLAGQPVRD